MIWYTLEYRDNRTHTRTKRYFKEKYLMNDYVNKNEVFIERAVYGCEEV